MSSEEEVGGICIGGSHFAAQIIGSSPRFSLRPPRLRGSFQSHHSSSFAPTLRPLRLRGSNFANFGGRTRLAGAATTILKYPNVFPRHRSGGAGIRIESTTGAVRLVAAGPFTSENPRSDAPMKMFLLSQLSGWNAPYAAALLPAICLTIAPALAGDLYWDANGSADGTGGTGDWNKIDSFWRADTDTGTLRTWTDGNAAILGGTSGTINLNSGNVSPTSLQVDTSGFKITTSANSRSLEVSGQINLASGVALTLEKTGTGGDEFKALSVIGMSGSSVTLASGLNSSSSAPFELSISGPISVPIMINGSAGGSIGITGNSISAQVLGGISNSSSSVTMLKANSGFSLALNTLGISGTSGVTFGYGGGGAGVINLDVSSNYGGSTAINTAASGKVRLGTSNALPSGTALTITQGTLELQGFSQTVASLQGAGGTISATSGSVLRVEGAASTTYSGATTGAMALEKAGGGTLTLASAQAYTGTTTISGGTLVVSGGLSGAGAATVSTGGKLAGTGTIIGATTIQSGGKYSAGALDAVGSQSFSSSLSFNSGSIFDWDLNENSTSSGFDTVSVTGNITGGTANTIFQVVLGSGTVLSDSFWTSPPGGTQRWMLSSIFGKNLSSGGFQAVQTSRDVSQYGTFTINSSALTWTPIPEASTALVGFLITAGLLRRTRERRVFTGGSRGSGGAKSSRRMK
jgi:autotransporter-associated beta strand protein